MPLLEDIGAGLQEFGRAFGEARRFRYERQMREQAHQLEKLRTDIALANLKEDQLARERKQQIDFQMQQLAERWNTAFNDPLARETEGIARGTLRQKVYDELSQITANMIALDPNRGEQFLGLTERHYFDPLERKRLEQANYQPSNQEKEVSDFERRFGRKVTEQEYKTWGKADAGDPEDKVIRDLTVDFLKDEKTMMLAKAQAESEGKVFDPVEYATTKATQALSIIERSKAQREAHKQRLETQKVGSSNVGELRKIESTPAEESIINEPQDTVEVDINDPRLRDTSFTESPFGIDVNAPATEEEAGGNEPKSEAEMVETANLLRSGRLGMTHKKAQKYFKSGVPRGYWKTQTDYDKFYQKYIKPLPK